MAEIPVRSAESVALAKASQLRVRIRRATSMFALMQAIGVVDTHLVDSHRRGSSGVWPFDDGDQGVFTVTAA